MCKSTECQNCKNPYIGTNVPSGKNDKEVKRLAEIILREMTDKKLPRVILEEALDIVDEKFLNDATI